MSLGLPWEPPAAYRLKLTVTRLKEEPGGLSIGLTSGPRHFSLRLDWPQGTRC